MSWLLVVNNPKRWNLTLPGVEIIPAKTYLSSPQYAGKRGYRVINMCRSYAYQSIGYYVSLLAEARGHRPQPSAATLQDFKFPSIMRSFSVDLDNSIQRLLKPLHSDRFTLSIYFGKNLARRYDSLCRQLFTLFPAPLMRAQFSRHGGRWTFDNLSPVATSEIPESHRDFIAEAARKYFSRGMPSVRKRPRLRYDLAVLVDAADPTPPSNETALRRLEKAGEKLGVRVERIGKEDFAELGHYDALFIRVTTAVNHYSYRFARRAQAEDMAVMDDPVSILRCSNKVYLYEALSRLKVPTPFTAVVHQDNLQQLSASLSYPCVLKQPDSAFSKGVIKADNAESFIKRGKELLEDSELLIVQEFVPTEFDWRIGLLDGKPLFACQYFMAQGHWQIYNHDARKARDQSGDSGTVPIDEVPEVVMQAALKAGRCMGLGLYGVDLKYHQGKAIVIEVNDNPNIDAGIEDIIDTDQLYERIIQSFINRIEDNPAYPGD